MQNIDPNYDTHLLAAERALNKMPLHERASFLAHQPEEWIDHATSDKAPMGLIRHLKDRFTEALTKKKSPFERGRLSVTCDDFEEAAARFEEALSQGDMRAHNNLGLIALSVGDLEGAHRHFSTLPDSLSCRISTYSTWLIDQKPKSIIKDAPTANPLLLDQPLHMQNVLGAEFALCLAQAHYELGEFDAAKHYLIQAFCKHNGKAANELGRLHMHPGYPGYNPQTALEFFKHAVALGYNEGYRSMAMVFLAHGQDAEAEQVLEEAELAMELMMSKQLDPNQ